MGVEKEKPGMGERKPATKTKGLTITANLTTRKPRKFVQKGTKGKNKSQKKSYRE